MYIRQNWLDKLERRFGRLAIPNLMTIIVGAMVIVYILSYAAAGAGYNLTSILMFDRNLILEGQVWRLFTFLFLPSSSGIVFVIISLYFYWMIGTTLENQWGAFSFTVYYLLGAIGAIASGFIAGGTTNSYLNLSLFLAFALLNPEHRILLFFFIPVKMKWLALIDGALLIYSFIIESWPGRLALIMALLNLLVFFTPSLIDFIKSLVRRYKWKRNFK